MKNGSAFGKALAAVLAYPVYLVFVVVLIVYACFGNWAEAFLLLAILAFSVVLRAYYLTNSVFPKTERKTLRTAKGTMERLRTVSFRISLAAAFCAVPLLIYSLIKETDGGISLALSRILSVMSLGLAVFSGAAGSPLEYTASMQLFPGRGADTALSIRSIDAAEKLAGCGKVLILNPLLLYDNTQEVRCVYFAGAPYRGMSLAESRMKSPAEICYLVSAFVQSVSSGRALTLSEQREKALDDFVNSRLQDARSLPFYDSNFSPFYNRLSSGDISIRVRSEKGTYIAYRTTAADALAMCGYQRNGDGEAKELDSFAEKALRDAVQSMRSENLIPYIYMTFPGVELPDSETRRGVLEAVIGVGGVCPPWNADVTEAMTDFGVTPILVIPAENATAKGFALGSGICRGEEQICYYSEYSAEGKRDPRVLAEKTVWVGFPPEELREAIRAVSSSGNELCIIPRESSDLSFLNMARTAVAVEERSDAQVAQVADSTVLPASLRDGRAGLPSLFSLLSEACTILCKITVLRNVLLTYGSFLLFVFAIALFCGADAILPTAAQLLLCGSAVTAASALTIAEDKVLMQSRTVLETDRSRIRVSCIRCAVLGLLMAIAVCLCGMLVFSETPLAAKNYLFCAMIACGVTSPLALRLADRRRYGVTGFNGISVVCILIGCTAMLFVGFFRMPDTLFSTFGWTAFPWKSLLFSLIPAAMPFIFFGAQRVFRTFSAG